MNNTISIRPATPADVERIKQISVDAGLFSTDEAAFFDEMTQGAFDGTLDGHHWLVAEDADGHVISGAQYAPEPYADRMWNLYFIAVDPAHQGSGVGSAVMAHVVAELTTLGDGHARTLVVETSSTDQYARTRVFYAGIGYTEEARIREFYGPDDHKIVFWKKLA